MFLFLEDLMNTATYYDAESYRKLVALGGICFTKQKTVDRRRSPVNRLAKGEDIC